MNKQRSIYLASPLFCSAELNFNIKIRNILIPKFDVYLPQEDGELLSDVVKSGGDIEQAKKRIFSCDIEAIKRCDMFFIILDGRTIDEGAAFELGYAYALRKICLGLQTDTRRLLPVGNNPMISCPLKYVFSSLQEMKIWIDHPETFNFPPQK